MLYNNHRMMTNLLLFVDQNGSDILQKVSITSNVYTLEIFKVLICA